MTYTFTTETATRPVPSPLTIHKFGRVEAVRTLPGGTDIDIRQPNGRLLTTRLDPHSIDTGKSEIRAGRNIWVSGQLEGAMMRAATFSVYAEEL